MKEQFVTYEIALKLKEKGFDGKCFCFYRENGQVAEGSICFGLIHNSLEGVYDYEKHQNPIRKTIVAAPLWQQVIDWLREKHSLDIMTRQLQLDGRAYYKITKIETEDKIKGYSNFCKSPYEAREKAIKQALTLI